ncbi:hypothetical protein SAMN05216600_1132 [Pseudomonas cuatrocienegasensis]|uniref:Uncharacterized protein n=1 Tax=Pseudomonas cuatrocienegasensis TaxID=543360 RepID=A0ABY1BJ43_9PSED|nr:hypothetical protein SAMN05216600_1132 [Pseudomonas cuatrocienegasensis]
MERLRYFNTACHIDNVLHKLHQPIARLSLDADFHLLF